jgi:DNA-binding transcriptional LysR family regulator
LGDVDAETALRRCSNRDIALLEDFKALVECMNFSRAAEARNVTQPAFSRRVRTLERWIGTPLFNRASHRLELTPAGERFRFVAEETLRRLYQGRQEALDAVSAASSLRFASTHVLSVNFFPAWLRQIEPGLVSDSVRLIADNMQGCERIMLQGQAHFLLCHYHPAALSRLNADDFVSMRLGEDFLIPISAADENGHARYTLPGVQDSPIPYLAFSEESGMGRIVAAARAQRGRPAWLKPVFSSHMAIVLKMFVTDGRGITWSPQSLIEGELVPKGKLTRAGDRSWDIPIEIRIFRPRARQDARAESFWMYLKNYLESASTENRE